MMTRRVLFLPTTRFALIALCSILGSSLAGAAERPMSLAEALDLTRRNNHDLAAGRAVLVEAQAAIDRTRGALLPTLTGAASYTHNYKNVTYANLLAGKDLPASVSGAFSSLDNIVVLKQDALQASAGVQVPLGVPGAYKTFEASKDSYRAAQANLVVTETTILFAAAQAFYAAAGADELLEARRHAVEVAQATLDNAQARFHAEKATRLEIDRAELAVVDATQALREAEDMQASNYRSLVTIAGLNDEPFHVAPAEAPVAGPADTAQLYGEALQLRPEFTAYEANIKAARAQSDAAHWQWAPTLSGFGNVYGYNYAGITGDYYSWALGLQLNWVLYDGGVRDADRHAADARRVQNAEHLLQLRSTVASDITNASRALLTKRQGVTSAERAAAISAEALGLVRLQYSAGTATQLDVLQAQDALVTAEVQRAQARFDLALADLTLQRDAGTFPDKALALR